MSTLHFAEKIACLRHERKITQEQLANFIGVTKSSVSKWENSQSLPDITLLPQLATFFNVTVDELLGYEPQLSKEQIQKLYEQLAIAFASRPFPEAMEESRELVRRYYSCFPFLQQVCVLWMNHFPLAGTDKEQKEILKEAKELCEHIMNNSKEPRICEETRDMRAMFDLLLGNPLEVIEALEDHILIGKFSDSNDGILIQAYQMAGQMENAISQTQISMYLRLIGLVGNTVQYLNVCATDLSICEETLRRVDCVIEAYELSTLHPNTVGQLEYQAALVFMMHKEQEKAMERLEKYVKLVCHMLKEDNMQLHGDGYFYCLDEWIERLQLGAMPPRHRELVAKDAVQTLLHPLFQELAEREDFIRLQEKIKGEKGYE